MMLRWLEATPPPPLSFIKTNGELETVEEAYGFVVRSR